MTVRDFAARWLALYPRAADRTNVLYEQMIRAFVRDHGARQLETLTVAEARKWSIEHPASFGYVRLMYADAISLGAAETNPFAGIRRPTHDRVGGRRLALSEAEVWTAADAALEFDLIGDELRTMILTVAYSGLRISEGCGLMPGDAVRGPDGLPRALQIVRQRHADGRCGAPKHGSEGLAPVLPPVRVALRDRLLAAVPPHSESPWLFTNCYGDPWTRTSFHRRWATICEATGISKPPHSLRHFYATYLVDRGATPMDVAIAMRHRDNGRLVQARYAHPDHDRARARLEALCQ